MYFTIRHVTRFRYSAPVSEALMAVRMHPRTEGAQTCLSFQLSVSPQTKINLYRDHLGNVVHHFDIPGHHTQLSLTAQALVEVRATTAPPEALEPEAWEAIRRTGVREAGWEMVLASRFARPLAELSRLVEELPLETGLDPLSLLRRLAAALPERFEIAAPAPRPPAELAKVVSEQRATPRDLAHVFIAVARERGIPCRFVSGYAHAGGELDEVASSRAMHAWAEAYLPGLGWVGFDPVAGGLAGERSIRVAVGRDGWDVPPTRGVYKGKVKTELRVSVEVTASESLPVESFPGGGPRWERRRSLGTSSADQQ